MKVKCLLRFYFYADSLESAIDNLILRYAFGSGMSGAGGDGYAQRICGLIGEKNELGGLWSYLDGIITAMTPQERECLRGYAALRVGIKRLSNEKRREIKRTVVKLTRRARRLESFSEGIKLVGKYYCVISPC